MVSDVGVSAETVQWIEDSGLEIERLPHQFKFAADFTNSYSHNILEMRPHGRVAWLEAAERTMVVSWQREFASLELAEKWIRWKTRTGARRIRLDDYMAPILPTHNSFADASPECVFVPRNHSEGGRVLEVRYRDEPLAWFPYAYPGGYNAAAEASRVLTLPMDGLTRALLNEDGSPFFTTESQVLRDSETFDWPGKDGDLESPWSPLHGTHKQHQGKAT